MRYLLTVGICFLSPWISACDRAAPTDASDPLPAICTCPVESDPRVVYLDKEWAVCTLAQYACLEDAPYLFERLYPTRCGCGCITYDYLDEAIDQCGFDDPRLEDVP